jgi:hypothetical protein
MHASGNIMHFPESKQRYGPIKVLNQVALKMSRYTEALGRRIVQIFQ